MNKKKINPIVVIIIVLVLVLIGILYFGLRGDLGATSNEENILETDATIVTVSRQNIENTLSSSGQISSELEEKLTLHASYYFEELLVDTNVYIEEGTNIVEYTNGTYLEAPYDCVLTSYNLPNEDEQCTTSHYVQLQSISALTMTLSISENDINKVSIGDEVDITITATGEVITGYITKLSEIGTYSSSGSTFTAIVGFANNGNLKIGMSATCEIIFETAENVISIPLEAIQEENGTKYVIKVNSDGTEENVTVEIGIENDAYVEIKSGLSEGDQIEMIESENESSFGGFNFGGNSSRGGAGKIDFSSGGGMPSGMEMPSGGNMGMPGM